MTSSSCASGWYFVMPSIAACALSRLRTTMITRAPRRLSSRVVSRPIPELAPVTTTVLPCTAARIPEPLEQATLIRAGAAGRRLARRGEAHVLETGRRRDTATGRARDEA